MKKTGRIFMAFTLIFVLLGCSKEKSTNDLNQNDQTTVPERWDGPTDTSVTSRDLGLCGKSRVAKEINLPGFITTNFTGEHITYRSSDEVVQFSPELMVVSDYKLEHLLLLRKKDSIDEIYIGQLNNKNKVTTVVVYKKGACS
ncbi:hypothetical protein V5E38_07765 [Rossellomorea sp. GAMAL-10_SWC]